MRPAVKQEPRQVPATDQDTNTGMIHCITPRTRSPNVCKTFRQLRKVYSIAHRCRSRQFFGGAKKIFPNFPKFARKAFMRQTFFEIRDSCLTRRYFYSNVLVKKFQASQNMLQTLQLTKTKNGKQNYLMVIYLKQNYHKSSKKNSSLIKNSMKKDIHSILPTVSIRYSYSF